MLPSVSVTLRALRAASVQRMSCGFRFCDSFLSMCEVEAQAHSGSPFFGCLEVFRATFIFGFYTRFREIAFRLLGTLKLDSIRAMLRHDFQNPFHPTRRCSESPTRADARAVDR